MKIAINEILITDRVRQDLGDLEALAESLARSGQLNPVTISQRNELIAGHRRVMAAQKLGWQYIEAHVVDMTDPADRLELELEENVHRKDFSPEELLEGYRRLERLRHPGIATRIGHAFKALFGFLFGWMKPRRGRRQEVDSGATVSGQPDDTQDDLYADTEIGDMT